MPKFLFVYHGGKTPETKEAGEAAMKAWGDWFNDLGPAVVDAGNPVMGSRTVDADGEIKAAPPNSASG